MEQEATEGTQSPRAPDEPWGKSAEDIVEALHVDPGQGLDAAEVACRRERFGLNRQRESQRQSLWRILLNQVKSLIVLLLAVAAVLSLIYGRWLEAGAVGAVLLINTAIGFFTELRAVRSMEALRKLGGATTVVRREGGTQEIDAEELVPGDIVILDAGDSVTADMRIIEASKLQADESTLTGESVPVTKTVKEAPADAVLAERSSMVFKGTFTTRGSGEAVVVHTGMETELGEIAALAEEAATEERTPLEERLDTLGRELLWLTLGIAVAIATLGMVRGKDVLLMVETGVALAVAAIPEGLPIVATVALARGMLRMARRHALIRRLAAVETLGATNIICVDKTGTLTENRMTVTRMDFDDGSVDIQDGGDGGVDEALLHAALEVGALCNNASIEDTSGERLEKGTGDPLEVALLEAAASYDIHREGLLETYPEVREVAFDPEVRMMATCHEDGGGFRVAVKGGPEAVLNACNRVRTASGARDLSEEAREQWTERSSEMAQDGLRVIAVATKQVDDEKAEPYADLEFLALAGMEDPPRSDVPDAVKKCQQAGIRVVMITGDQPMTARKIAAEVGLVDETEQDVLTGRELAQILNNTKTASERLAKTAVLARVSPKQKLDLIESYQNQGFIVAMTGDGVNDAPALNKADIGIAMGQRGTQVAREAADMVLRDDALSSIVVAVEQGRIIFGNIRKFVVYLLSCNTSEVLVVGIASFLNVPLPLLPLQILFLNLVTDVFPALALGVGRGDPSVMEQPPRDAKEPVLPRIQWARIGVYGLVMTGAVLGALAMAIWVLGFDDQKAVTVSFLTLGFAQLWHVFNMRDVHAGLFVNDVTQNIYVWGALGLCTVLLLLAAFLPGLSFVLETTAIGREGWALVIGMSVIPMLAGGAVHLARGVIQARG